MKPTLNITIALIILFSFTFLPQKSHARLSKKKQERVDKLLEIAKPNVPILGKINAPLMAEVSINEYIPETVYEPENDIKINNETIALTPSTSGKGIESLKQERNILQQAEIEGLNFIQPSLELTIEEQKAIDEFFTRNEQEQLLNLWRATIERNKTIQFIIQKLNPESSPAERHSILSKTIGAAIFLPFYALQAVTNNAGAYYGSQVGSRVLGGVLEGKMKKDKAVLQLSQTESITLFMMIDEIAERLRQRYHSYKHTMVEKALATAELEETKKDNLLAQESNSTSAGILADIQRRAVERDIRKLDAEVRYYRNSLIELAGLDAIQALENQLTVELAATANTPLDWGYKQ